MGGVQRGEYLGIHEAAGVPCHHLAFEQATIDWQLWIDAGKDPLPRKLVITYKTEDEVPQYTRDHPEVESGGAVTGCAVRVHAARGRQPGGRAGIGSAGRSRRREERDESSPDSCGHPHRAGHRLERRARGTTRLSGVRVVTGTPAGPATRPRGRASAPAAPDGEPDQLRRHGHPTGPDAERCVADHDQGRGRREQAKSTRRPRPPRRGASRPRDPARSRGRAVTRPSRGARAPAPGVRPPAKAWRAAPTTGQPAVAGTVNTKYNGTYNAAAARTPYGGWNTAVAGPYGGRVTTTLPSGYRTTTYYGRPYYTLRRRLLPAVYLRWRALLLPGAAAVLLRITATRLRARRF